MEGKVALIVVLVLAGSMLVSADRCAWSDVEKMKNLERDFYGNGSFKLAFTGYHEAKYGEKIPLDLADATFHQWNHQVTAEMRFECDNSGHLVFNERPTGSAQYKALFFFVQSPKGNGIEFCRIRPDGFVINKNGILHLINVHVPCLDQFGNSTGAGSIFFKDFELKWS